MFFHYLREDVSVFFSLQCLGSCSGHVPVMICLELVALLWFCFIRLKCSGYVSVILVANKLELFAYFVALFLRCSGHVPVVFRSCSGDVPLMLFLERLA